MARRKKSDPAEPSEENRGNAGHNIGNIDALMVECCSKWLEIVAARSELNEQAGEMRKRLKDAGINRESFAHSLKVFQMEPEGRDDYLDWVRRSYSALGIGTQSTMFEEPEMNVGDEQKRKARQAGHDAGVEGQPSTANPHESKSPLRAEWHDGWIEQQSAAAREMAPENKPGYIGEQEPAGSA